MSNYAKINADNIVENVIVCEDSSVNMLDGFYVKETESTGFASVGFTWNKSKGKFIKIQTYPSWTLNEETCEWEPPTPRPVSPWNGYWDEESQEWIELILNPEE